MFNVYNTPTQFKKGYRRRDSISLLLASHLCAQAYLAVADDESEEVNVKYKTTEP